ncbi:MAG: recombinase [Bacilli bacterium]|nr:recombinase [Bacilli bacterium]
MVDYEIKVEENSKRNEKYIEGFEKWLIEKGLVSKTIRKHLSNVNLYINDYLNYYDVIKAEDGIDDIYSFIDGWFIRKCLWASKNSIKEMIASLKKFYQYMSENNYVSIEDYKDMCIFIKDSMDDFFETLDDFDNGTYYDIF